MDWNEQIRLYGQDDNSVTDRMWYELAGEICLYLYDLAGMKKLMLTSGVRFVEEKMKEYFHNLRVVCSLPKR